MNPFVYRHWDLKDRAYLGALPYQAVSFGMGQLNTPGSFNGTLALADPRVQRTNWQACTRLSRTALIVELQGEPIWGGIVWTSAYDDGTPQHAMKVTASSFSSYLAQRLQAEDYSNTWTSGADPMVVARQVITDALALGTLLGGITIVLHPPAGEGGPQTAPSYPSTALQSTDSILQTLSQMGYGFGFDYSIDVAYRSASDRTPVLTLNLWYPRQGRPAGETHLAILQRHVLATGYPADGTQQATRVTETGSGTGGVQPVQAIAETVEADGWPILERTFNRAQVNDQGTLGNIAAGDLWLYAWPVCTPQITLALGIPDSDGRVAPGTLSFESFELGDELIWRIDPLADPYSAMMSPRFPAGMNYPWRVTGWQAQIADQSGQLSTLALTLGLPPGEGVPLPPPGVT